MSPANIAFPLTFCGTSNRGIDFPMNLYFDLFFKFGLLGIESLEAFFAIKPKLTDSLLCVWITKLFKAIHSFFGTPICSAPASISISFIPAPIFDNLSFQALTPFDAPVD